MSCSECLGKVTLCLSLWATVGPCHKPKTNKKKKSFKKAINTTWSDSEDDEQPPKEATCLMAQEKLEVPLNSSSFNNL